MRHKRLSWITGTALLALLATPFMVLAQDQAQEQSKRKHYTLVDLGTLGGPNSYGNFITPRGTVVGGASTSVPDPICTGPWDGSCYYEHAFEWRKGVLTDLGTLDGGNNSLANAINSHGSVFGVSENGLSDPVYGVRAFVGTIWEHGEVEDLGTLGGGLVGRVSPSTTAVRLSARP